MTPAVIYARFSPRPNPEECDSVEKQLERCRAYSVGHGYTVVAEHHDKDLSGGRADNRPGLQAAIAAACRRKAVLVVYALSRLARNTRDAIDLAERLNAAGADLAVIQENVNTRSPMGRFIFTLFSALAQLEREQIAERTSSAMLRHQAKGRRMTRPDRCPYGWQPDPADPDHLVEDAEEQAAIGRIREEHRQGRGLRAIARVLDQAGIGCRGGCWSHSAVRSVLRRAGQLAEAS
ncbi:MAG TPA: recombinase family protein [Gemmataceae bacterium]|jgi:DNA invertase Pin-like site-specific DNA recombinase|nr:recombinase family protein [Gemmataceae bacterium]